MKKNQKIIVILIGPPGSGKGTQAGLLAEKLGLYSFETSRVLEESWVGADKNDYIEADGKKFYLLKEKKIFDEGKLCDPPFVAFMVEKKIRELAGQGKGIVFSGSPRTVYEGKKLMPLLLKLYGKKNILVLELKVSDKEAIWRNVRRKICSKCRYPVPYTKETQKLTKCPKCGGLLVVRNLDTEKTMKVRLKEYKNRTYPLFDYFREIGVLVKEINGEQSIEDVFRDILKVVSLLIKGQNLANKKQAN